MCHRVLVHRVLVNFLACDLGLDIRDEVLDVFDGLTLLGNPLEVVGWWVISHEKIVKFGVGHVKDLDEGAQLVNTRHVRHVGPCRARSHAGLDLPREVPTR